METFIQPKITGYRQLNETEAALMNRVKSIGLQLGELVTELHKMPASVPDAGYTAAPRLVDGVPSIDQRWVDIGATDLQTGLMALTRAISQPTTF